MGSEIAEFWRGIPRFNWLGHQSRFVLPPCIAGHLPAL
jgi:hypothetical protein